MKTSLLIILIALAISGCSTKYSYYTQEGSTGKWDGPYQGQFEPDMIPPPECNQVAWFGPHTVRIHNEETGKIIFHKCHDKVYGLDQL